MSIEAQRQRHSVCGRTGLDGAGFLMYKSNLAKMAPGTAPGSVIADQEEESQ
jgi:hypothetical protein